MEGLDSFIRQSFTEAGKWRNVNLNHLKKLIIDGKSVCHELYRTRHSWELGGEYQDFNVTLKEFFGELLHTGVKLTVVFHGYQSHEQSQIDQFRRLGSDSNRRIRHQVAKVGHAFGELGGFCFLPLLAECVFMETVKSLGIQFQVVLGADEEARKGIVALANKQECPVLGCNSDYFMFKLDHGYIPFHTVCTIIASSLLYHTEDFQTLFQLQDPDLRLLIPVLYSTRSSCHPFDFKLALEGIAAFENIEAYLKSEEDNELVVDSYKAARSYYADADFCFDEKLASVLGKNVPHWIVLKYKEGLLHPELLNVLLNCTNVLGILVEDMNSDSAWLASRHVRQCCYNGMGLTLNAKVKEVIRAKASAEVTETFICPTQLECAGNFTDLKIKELQDLFLCILQCNGLKSSDTRQEFDGLAEELKLPVVTVYYWYQTCDHVQRHLVKSLLLSFFTCSGRLSLSDRFVLDPVSRDTRRDHLASLHSFAQWQCIYHDTLAMNNLLGVPFQSTSPASLFSGKVATFYASFIRKNRSPDEMLVKGSELWNLYNSCLYLVTGCDGDGRRGEHAKALQQSRSQRQPISPQTPAPLTLFNRYGAFSSLKD